MKRLLFALVVMTPAVATSVGAQETSPAVPAQQNSIHNSARDWQSSYQEESARDYIRRRAQEQSAARRARIEGMNWLGHSPSRPLVNPTPFMSNPPRWIPIAPTGYWGNGFWSTRGMVRSPVWLY